MKRVPEPELMNGIDQARAYAFADFEAPHSSFIRQFANTFPEYKTGKYVLDLGCGTCDISIRFAKAYHNCRIHGIDGSNTMLSFGKLAVTRNPQIKYRIRLFSETLPTISLNRKKYDTIISNSLLHHLHDPYVLWNTIKQFASSGAEVFVMDLRRPDTITDTRIMREKYTANEPEILQRDFYNSLLAAFDTKEIKEQLSNTGLDHLSVKPEGDRHVIICGKMK